MKNDQEKGWFWFCPIFWESETETLGPRYWFLGWLLDITIFLHQSMLFMAQISGIEIDLVFPIKLNKK